MTCADGNLAMIERIAAEGIAAIERGDFAFVSGAEGSRALLGRLNARAVDRERLRPPPSSKQSDQ